MNNIVTKFQLRNEYLPVVPNNNVNCVPRSVCWHQMLLHSAWMGSCTAAALVSQEILPPGKNVAAAKFPRIDGRYSTTE